MQAFLLKKRFTVLNLNYKQIHSQEMYHSFTTNNDKLMTVFLITSKQEFENMMNITKLITRRKILNVVLFMNIDESPMITMCMKPIGNPFQLKNGVSILVKCYENPVIHEWLSTNNKIVVKERANWTMKSGLIFKSKHLLTGNREFLHNKTLLAASIKVKLYFL